MRALFARYESFLDRSISGSMHIDEFGSFSNHSQAYGHYRQIGTRKCGYAHSAFHRQMSFNVWPTLIEPPHSTANIIPTWSKSSLAHYLLQTLKAEPQIFGWMSGDEVLKKQGIA